MTASTDDSFSKSVLISTVTRSARTTSPGRIGVSAASVGGRNSMNFAPNTVEEAMSTRALAGTIASRSGSIASWIAAVPSGWRSIAATRPIWTPSIFTLASGFNTNPLRSARTVSGALGMKLPRKSAAVSATRATRPRTVTNPTRGRIR